jgi:deoxycytidylate deaminase
VTRSRPDWDETWMRVAFEVSHRSLCDGDQVGAVIASPTNRVVAVGYNNPPAGFGHEGMTCSLWCPNQAPQELIGWEVDPKKLWTDHPRVTSFEFTNDVTVIEVDDSTLYTFDHDNPNTPNDIREIMKACGYRPVFPGRKDSNIACPTLHAEANALSVCDRSQREGGTIYVTSAPCFACAKLIANSGLARVVYRDSERGRDRVRGSEINPLDFMDECGIKVSVDECIDCPSDSAERRHPYVRTTEGSC